MIVHNEDTNLYRGIFWIKDLDNLYNNDLYFQIPCDSNGNIDSDFEISTTMSSTNTTNYNHQRVWNTLDKKYTDNKAYNYYPRGRIEIHNGIATIYASPYIDSNNIIEWTIDKFNLTEHNGIKKVRFIADGSEHYKCYFDFE